MLKMGLCGCSVRLLVGGGGGGGGGEGLFVWVAMEVGMFVRDLPKT